MIAPFVITLLVGTSSALLTCPDAEKLVLDTLKAEKGDVTPIEIQNFERKMNFIHATEKKNNAYKAFIVYEFERTVEIFPRIIVNDKPYDLVGFAYDPLGSEQEVALLTVVFNPKGKTKVEDDTIDIVIPLIITKDMETEDANRAITWLLNSKERATYGMPLEWLGNHFTNIPPTRITTIDTATKAKGKITFLADCSTVLIVDKSVLTPDDRKSTLVIEAANKK